MRRWLIVWAAVSLAFGAVGAQAAGGSLDQSFGIGGKVVTDFGSSTLDLGYGVAIQADGKIVAAGYTDANPSDDNAGDFALARYKTNGALDASFGSGGKAQADFSGHESGKAVAIQTDGKIVVAGYAGPSGLYDFALARFKTDGTLDTSFGSGGKVETDGGGTTSEEVSAVALQTDGKIVVAGSEATTYVNPANVDFALVRYTATGVLDSTFGTGGKVLTDFSSDDHANAVAIQRDGKIVAAGYVRGGDGSKDFSLARYNPDGTLDTSFGSGGNVVTDLGLSDAAAQAVTLQTDGKTVAAGWSYQDVTGYDFALARYDSNGTLDTTFGNAGKTLTDVGAVHGADQILVAAVQSDGKIVAAGMSTANGTSDFALGRYTTSGVLDASFGIGGSVLTNIGNGSEDGADALAIAKNGKIVVAGSTNANGSSDFAIARYKK